MNIVSCTNIKKHYESGDNVVKALDGVSLNIKRGEFLAVVGTSGSGKTTLLNILGGLDRSTFGTVNIEDKNIDDMSDDQLTIFRRRNIGFVFQQYNLLPILNVYENISLPIQLDGGHIDRQFIEEVAKTLSIDDKLTSMVTKLSGGQQQRVAIARALASKPSIILADEPTGNLDSKTSLEVIGLLKVTSKKYNQTIIMITHNEHLAQLCDRIIRLEDGRIISEGGLGYEK